MSSLQEKNLGKGYLFTFLVCCAAALAIYVPFLIIDKGLFQYCGDFNTQQIPFYTYMNGFVKSGAGQWSWETDLGSSVVNSYAFSGFTVYNTFFNHFVDCVALFPFLLWALDEYMYEGRRAVFPVMVAVNCLNNYFFFAGQIVFLFVYFFVRLASREYRIRVSGFVRLAFESLLGHSL